MKYLLLIVTFISGLVGLPAQAWAADACSKGVLVSVPDGKCVQDLSFSEYVGTLLKQGIPIVMFLAVILIAYSGIQYMLGGSSADNTKKAKQRIIGILVGVAFFLAIDLILTLLSPGLTLTI